MFMYLTLFSGVATTVLAQVDTMNEYISQNDVQVIPRIPWADHNFLRFVYEDQQKRNQPSSIELQQPENKINSSQSLQNSTEHSMRRDQVERRQDQEFAVVGGSSTENTDPVVQNWIDHDSLTKNSRGAVTKDPKSACFSLLSDSLLIRAGAFERRTNFTESDCANICLKSLQDVHIECLCFTYNRLRHTCDLFSTSALSPSVLIVRFSGTDYYQLKPRCRNATMATTSVAIPQTTSTIAVESTTMAVPVESCPSGESPILMLTTGFELLGAEGITVPDVTLEQCKASCKRNLTPDNQPFMCLSAQYSPLSTICSLSAHAAEPQRNGILVASSNIIYIEKICLSDDVALYCPMTLQRYPQKQLLGYTSSIITVNTLKGCISACLDSMQQFGVTCRSAMFYFAGDIKSENCIFNTVSHETDESLFIDEDLDRVTYFSLNDCARRSRRQPLEQVNQWYKWWNILNVTKQTTSDTK